MDDSDISRRRVLSAAGVAGTLALGGGAGAYATLGDTESFRGYGAAGTLDLRVLAEAGVTPGAWTPALDGSSGDGAVSLTEPAGTVGLALAVCENPGFVTVRLSSDDLDAVGDAVVELLAEDGGDPRVVATGSLADLVDRADNGIPLHAGCSYLGKLETEDEGESFVPEDGETAGEDTFVFEHDGETVTVTVTGRHYKDDGEVAGIDLAVEGGALCRVNVKGGGRPAGTPGGGGGSGGGDSPVGSGVASYGYECAETATDLYAPVNPGGEQSAVSNVELYVCDGSPCIECRPEDPFLLYLRWRGATGEATLDVDLTARQCRHRTEDPE